MFRPFPHVLLRIAAEPMREFEELCLPRTMEQLCIMGQEHRTVAVLKEELCNYLFEAIRSARSDADRVHLINLKRDIFNARNIHTDDIHFLQTYLLPSTCEVLQAYVQARGRLPQIEKTGEDIFIDEIRLARKNLSRLAQNTNLQKGLILSSPALQRSINLFYLQRDDGIINRKDRDTEEGLIKYLSRIYAKTSPFSTFTNLGLAKLVEDAQTPLPLTSQVQTRPGDDPADVTSHVRLNNFLYQHLRGLITKLPAIYRLLLVRPNPTIRREEGAYRFLTNNSNIEAFQRLPFSAAIQVLLELGGSVREGVPFRDLVQSAIERGNIDASFEELEDFLNRLVTFGLFEFNLMVSGTDPDWDVKLRGVLRSLSCKEPIVSELVEVLNSIRHHAASYETATFSEREQILVRAHAEFKDVCFKLHELAGLPAEERLPQKEFTEFLKHKFAEAKREQGPPPEAAGPELQASFSQNVSTRFQLEPINMFYEDSTCRVQPLIGNDLSESVLAVIDEVFAHLKIFEMRADDRDKMAAYFNMKYGGRSQVELLTFYEDYYRDFKKTENSRSQANRLREQTQPVEAQPQTAERPPDPEGNSRGEGGTSIMSDEIMKNPLLTERMKIRNRWLEEFERHVRSRLPHGTFDQVDLSLAEIRLASESIGISGIERTPCSYGVFLQFIHDTSTTNQSSVRVVVNNVFPGFGKMMSRFLHVLDGAATQDLRIWNQHLSSEGLLIEDRDASYFNANLHPPLLPYEIWMPNGHNSLGSNQQVSVTELSVSLANDGRTISLVHTPTGKPAQVFDLGFQGWGGRSQLFQLLERFSVAEYLSLSPLINVLDRVVTSSGGKAQSPEGSLRSQISVLPRIVLENAIVIRRKAWIVPKDLLPIIDAKATEWNVFRAFNEWRESFGIPSHVFVFIAPRNLTGRGNPPSKGKIGRDDYKPQYINFGNPFLMNLLRKLCNKVSGDLRIEEMLPRPDQLLEFAEDRYVSEFMAQWYSINE